MHYGYGYVGDICDTCCVPQLTFQLDTITPPGSCDNMKICVDASVLCDNDITDNCVGELPFQTDTLNLYIYDSTTMMLHYFQDIFTQDSSGCIDIAPFLEDFNGKTVNIFFSIFNEYNCNVDTLYSDTVTITVDLPDMIDHELNASITNHPCLLGSNYSPRVSRVDNFRIDYPSGYRFCNESELIIEGSSFQINRPSEFRNMPTYLELGGVFYSDSNSIINDGFLKGTITLCNTSTGELCEFSFEKVINYGNMCDMPGLMCDMWAMSWHNTYRHWADTYPQFFEGHVYFYKELTLPYVMKDTSCEITNYRVRVYAHNLLTAPNVVFQNIYTNTEPIPYTLFPNVSFNISDAAYSNVEYFLFEIINNFQDTCTFVVSKDGLALRRSQDNEFADKHFKVYPNPATQTVFIESNQTGKYKLMDLKGDAKYEGRC